VYIESRVARNFAILTLPGAVAACFYPLLFLVFKPGFLWFLPLPGFLVPAPGCGSIQSNSDSSSTFVSEFQAIRWLFGAVPSCRVELTHCNIYNIQKYGSWHPDCIVWRQGMGSGGHWMAKDYATPTVTGNKVGSPDPGMEFLRTASCSQGAFPRMLARALLLC